MRRIPDTNNTINSQGITLPILYHIKDKIQKVWILWVAMSQKHVQKRSRTFICELVALSAHIALCTLGSSS